ECGVNIVECGIAFEDSERLSHNEEVTHFIANTLCNVARKQDSTLQARPVRSFDDLAEAYKLVYKEYLARKYCSPNPRGMHYTAFCFLPETRTFILEKKGSLLGTLTLIPDTLCGLPSEAVFPGEIKKLRQPGRYLAEVSLLALDLAQFMARRFALADLMKLSQALCLFKVMINYSDYAGITDLVISVHPKHEKLYRYFEFKSVSEIRSYAAANNNPALAMHLDYESFKKNASSNKRLKAYMLEKTTPVELFKNYYRWNPDLIRQWSQPIQPLQPAVCHYLNQCYPDLNLPATDTGF
ncbi:MAG: hypothetical protein NC930_06035, partial [Candidatus Omnitrophica bacterium]|nr:hypothetical protein [Candidatus Omnitrophota bacterium]